MINAALLSYCCNCGVGIAGLEFYRHLPFSRWLVVPHRRLGISSRFLDSRCLILPQELEPDTLIRSLEGIDILFCIERGYYPGLLRAARKLGVRVILMPNAEWFEPCDPDISGVDAFIAPTIACLEMLIEAGFGSRTEYIPHAIDTDRFRFRSRERANIFLHCRGWGGYKQRKGTDILLRSTSLCSEVDFIVASQEQLDIDFGNVCLQPSTVEPQEQYESGDVCIQPSRWEGVGLQILEAMACGLPTIVPDAAPMNEYPIDRTLCIPAHPSKIQIGKKLWVQWEMDFRMLANRIKMLHREPIDELSVATRRAIERRSWAALKPVYLKAMDMASE